MKMQQYQDYQHLISLSEALRVAQPKANRRVQVKMPEQVVEMLDQVFPDIDRSKILTQAALEILIRKLRIQSPELENWVQEEQYDLDRMWSYLDEREKI